MKLSRFEVNPILSPSKNWWEINATFNPAATMFGEEIYLLYRALGGDGLSRFGLAVSNDGKNFKRFLEPILEGSVENPYERLGIEDARIAKIEDTYYIVYTAASVYSSKNYQEQKFAPSLSHPAPWRVRPSLITTKDFRNFVRHGILLDKDTKDATLFPEKVDGKFALLHRVYPHVYLTFSEDLKSWENESILFSPRIDFWDSERVGAGAAPIKTDKGWLLFYHGTDKDHKYSLGVVLLDRHNPRKVIYRSAEPILSPELPYEKVGLTPNVVFTCGAVEKEDKFLIYYGAADKVICLASLDKTEIDKLL